MSTIMTIQGKQFTISDETDISENMYDDEKKVMRIVLHNTNSDLYNLITAALLNMKDLGTITFEQKGNTLTLHNPVIIYNTIIDKEYTYEFESSVFTFDNNSGQLLKVQRLNEYAKLPTRSYEYDAGVDLYSIESVRVEPFASVKIHTGIAIQLPNSTYGRIADRSSLASKNLHVFGGVVDQGYTGEIIIIMYNADQHVHNINKGDKVAQLIITQVCYAPVVEVHTLDNSPRNKKGFGSTGK